MIDRPPMAFVDHPAQVVSLTPDYCLATWHQIYIVIWRQETTMAGVQDLDRRLVELEPGWPAGCGLLTIIEQGAPMPSSEVRTALARFMTAAARAIKSSGVAFEGAGFRAAAVRGVVTGLTMLARQPYPHKVFATTPEAARWLAASLKETAKLDVDAGALIGALEELRERVNKG